MRAARQQMCIHLSVPEDLVLEWIADEEAQPGYLLSETVLTNIIDLYELALRDRVSLIMWQRYIDFIASLARSKDTDVQDTATAVLGSGDGILLVLRRAIDATYTHYLQSQALWSQYCDYIEQNIAQAANKDRNELIELLQAVFLERLAQPHTGLEDTFAMYSEFTTKYNEAHYEQQMVEANKMVSNTRAQCKLRDSFEDSLINSEGSWYAYAQYIDRLAKDKRTNPNEISMLYERALVYNCYIAEIWTEYISYLDGAFDDKSIALKTAHRAIRNCPWSGKLWAHTIHFTFVQAGK
ncbi:Splicing factor, partial [Coemansia brasiliensis]